MRLRPPEPGQAERNDARKPSRTQRSERRAGQPADPGRAQEPSENCPRTKVRGTDSKTKPSGLGRNGSQQRAGRRRGRILQAGQAPVVAIAARLSGTCRRRSVSRRRLHEQCSRVLKDVRADRRLRAERSNACRQRGRCRHVTPLARRASSCSRCPGLQSGGFFDRSSAQPVRAASTALRMTRRTPRSMGAPRKIESARAPCSTNMPSPPIARAPSAAARARNGVTRGR